MTIDRAIEILDPEHREHYDGGLTMVTYALDSDDLHDGAEIKLPREAQQQ